MTDRIESIQQVEDAVNSARREITRADAHIKTMARMVAGRLQNANVYHTELVKLKKELANYNIHTGRWK